MTDAALAAIYCFSGAFSGVILLQATCPGHLVGINVDDPGLHIYCWTTPLGTTVEAGKDDCLLIEAEGHKLAFAAKCSKLLNRPRMSLRCTICQHIFSQDLACIWLRL